MQKNVKKVGKKLKKKNWQKFEKSSKFKVQFPREFKDKCVFLGQKSA